MGWMVTVADTAALAVSVAANECVCDMVPERLEVCEPLAEKEDDTVVVKL